MGHGEEGEKAKQGKLQPSHAGTRAVGTVRAPRSRTFLSVLCTPQGLCSHSSPVAFVQQQALPSRGSHSRSLPGPAPLAGRLDTTWRRSKLTPRPPLPGQRGHEFGNCPQTEVIITGLGWDSSGSCRKRSRRGPCQHTSRLAVRERQTAEAGNCRPGRRAKCWWSRQIARPFPSAAELSPGLSFCEGCGGGDCWRWRPLDSLQLWGL